MPRYRTVSLTGDLGNERYAEMRQLLGAASVEGSSDSLLVDLSTVTSIAGMIAVELVVFIHRQIRNGCVVAIVPPDFGAEWLQAASLKDAAICDDFALADQLLRSLRV